MVDKTITIAVGGKHVTLTAHKRVTRHKDGAETVKRIGAPEEVLKRLESDYVGHTPTVSHVTNLESACEMKDGSIELTFEGGEVAFIDDATILSTMLNEQD